MTTPADLVERVAAEMWQAESMRAVGTRRTVPWSEAGEAAHMQWRPLAKAAVAFALEEAAQIADADATRDGDFIAAAIRGMIPSGTIPAQDDTGNAE